MICDWNPIVSVYCRHQDHINRRSVWLNVNSSWTLLRDDSWTQSTSFQPMKPSFICKDMPTRRTHDTGIQKIHVCSLRDHDFKTGYLVCGLRELDYWTYLFRRDHWRVSIFAEFVGQMTDLNLLPANGATCRTYARSFARIRSVFTDEGTVSAGLWPAHSPYCLSFLPLSFVEKKSVQEHSANLGRAERRHKSGDKHHSAVTDVYLHAHVTERGILHCCRWNHV